MAYIRAQGQKRSVRVFRERLDASTSVRCNKVRIRRGESWQRERCKRGVRAVCSKRRREVRGIWLTKTCGRIVRFNRWD
jgi:hypothetical protein